MRIQTDIAIIGAGPAGTMAALSLAKLGLQSSLFDKAVFPRDKICGDALSGKVVEVFRKLDPGLVDRIAADPAHLGSWGVNFVAPNTNNLRVPFRKDYDTSGEAQGFIAKRVDFDNLLVNEVKRTNLCDLHEGIALTDFSRKDDQWVLRDKSNDTEVRA